MTNAANTAFEIVSASVYSAGATRPLKVAVYRSFPTRSGAVRWAAAYGAFEVDQYPTREAAIDGVLANLQSRGAKVRDDFEAWYLTVRCATKAVRLVAREAAEA